MTVYLVRHTSVANDRKLCYGQSEVRLAASFGEEAAVVSVKLPAVIDVCISSPLTRCLRLAAYVCESRGLEFTTDNALKELNFGAWEQKPWDSIGEEAVSGWAKDFVNNPCPGGESFAMLDERVRRFWTALGQQYGGDDENVVLITHGGVIRSMLSYLGKAPLDKAFTFEVEPGDVVRVSADGYRFV